MVEFTTPVAQGFGLRVFFQGSWLRVLGLKRFMGVEGFEVIPIVLAVVVTHSLHCDLSLGLVSSPRLCLAILPRPRIAGKAFLYLQAELARRAMNRELLMSSMLVAASKDAGKECAPSHIYACGDGSLEVNRNIQFIPCSRRHLSSLSRRRTKSSCFVLGCAAVRWTSPHVAH